MTTERYAPFRREISIRLKPWSVQYRLPVWKEAIFIHVIKVEFILQDTEVKDTVH